jgi:prepilin-type processing-associated H-X9-DG protein
MPTCQWSYTGLMGSPYHVDAAATCARCRRVCNPNGNQALFDVYTGALPGEVPAPANTIMMVEFRIGNGAGAIRDVDSGNPAGLHAYLEAIQNDHAWQTHNDGNNFNFCDGHAKWLRWPDFGMYTLCAEDDI